MSMLNKCMAILPPGECSFLWGWGCRFAYVLYSEYGSCYLFWNKYQKLRKLMDIYTLNQQICREKIWLNQKTISQSQMYYYLKTQWFPVIKDLQVYSNEDEEVLIEYTLANPMPFKDVIDCVVNNEKVHLTKEDLALSNTEIENWFTKQNKWLAVILITSFIVLSFVVGIIMVKKQFSVRNIVTTINTSVSKVEKQLVGAISHLNTIRVERL